MTTYPNLIADVCRTEKTIKNVSLMIPVLVRWAQMGQANTYGDLAREINNPKLKSGMSRQLGSLHNVLEELRKKTGLNIPSLNVLIQNSKHIPSDGFMYVCPGYEYLSHEGKTALVRGLEVEAYQYKDWNLVLEYLGLQPLNPVSETDESKIRNSLCGGEGPRHKMVKEYVMNHPESIGLHDVLNATAEHVLLSGDRIDVFFELKNGTYVAVEVKSSTSDDADILRGLYQCVKYHAVMDAESKTHNRPARNAVMLVIEGELSATNLRIKNSLGVDVFENYKVETI